jgi:hypothetical protein
MRALDLSIHNLFSRTMSLGSNQPLREMYQEAPEGKGRPVHKANSLTLICEQGV